MKILLLILACFLVSCSQSPKSSDKQETLQVDSALSLCGMKQIYMDTLDNPTSGHIRYYENNGKACLIQSNNKLKMARAYDYFSGKKLGEMKTGRIDGELFAYNLDSVFLFVGGKGKSIISVFRNNQVKEIKIPVKERIGHVEQHPKCRFDGGIYLNGKWYFPCFRLGELPDKMKSGKDRFPLLELDVEKGKYRFIGAYPGIYAHNNMGSTNYWYPNICRGHNMKEVVVGFDASPQLLVYSPITGESRFESVKSVYADTIPLPLTEKGRDYFSESESSYYYAQYAHYGAISYDPWRNIYYRFVGIGLNDWSLEPSILLPNRKKWSVMVFDESFRKLGEQYLGDKYNVPYHFVSPDGLYILNKDGDENVANYSLFKYIGR